MKTALITGITGQDGLYLTGLLLKKGYEVHGIVRCASSFNIDNLGARSHIQTSVVVPEYTAETDARGTLRLFDAPNYEIGF